MFKLRAAKIKFELKIKSKSRNEKSLQVILNLTICDSLFHFVGKFVKHFATRNAMVFLPASDFTFRNEKLRYAVF